MSSDMRNICNIRTMTLLTYPSAVKRMDVQGFVSKNDWLGKPDHKKDRPWLMGQR
jgi:hypothetical protein